MISAAFLAAAALLAQDEENGEAVGRIGVYHSALTQLASPRALGFDAASGVLFVVESDRDRVSLFSSAGEKFATFGEPGELLDPRGIAVDTERVFVADSGRHRIVEFARDGKLARTFGGYGAGPGQFRDPRGIALSAEALFVCDTGNDRVQKLARDGRALAQVGERGFGHAQFIRPTDVALDANGFVYVTDTGNHRVQKFDRDLRFVATFGDFGPHPGFFAQPEGIDCVGAELYVVDSDNHRVQVFDLDGKRLFEWGLHALRPREAEGRLHYPGAIAVLNRERAAIGEAFEDRVQIFRAAAPGEAILVFNPAERVVSAHYGQHLDVAGDLLALSEPAAPSLMLYDVEHREQPWEPIQITRLASWGRKFGQFLAPVDVAIDWSRKVVYVADADASKLACFRFAHDEQRELGFDPFLLKLVRSLDFEELHRRGEDRSQFAIRPAAIECDATGNVWVLDSLQRALYEFSPSLDLLTRVDGSTWFQRPVDFAFEPGPNALFVVDELAGRAFTLTSFRSSPALSNSFGEFVRPVAIATSAKGDVFVSDTVTARIHHFRGPALFGAPDELAGFGSPGLGPAQFHKPHGLCVDALGRLWVDDWGNHRIQVFDADGKFLSALGSRLFTRPATHPEDKSGK